MSKLIYIVAWRWLGDKPWPNPMMAHMIDAGIILCMHLANERRRYIVMSSLIGWAHAQNDSCVYIWVRSRNCGCIVTWFCYQLIAKPGNKTATVPWPDPYASASLNARCSHQVPWYPTRCRRPFKMKQPDQRKCIWNHTDGLVQYCSNSRSISNRVTAVLQYSH